MKCRLTVCRRYSELVYTNVGNSLVLGDAPTADNRVFNCHNVLTLIVGGNKAKPKEYPHMVIKKKKPKTETKMYL